MPATQSHKIETDHVVAPSRTAAQERARWPFRSAVDVLLALCIPIALALVLVRGSAHSSTALAVVLAALAARIGGLSAALVFAPLLLLSVYTFTQPNLSWTWLVWDLLIAMGVGALVADLRARERRAQQQLQSARGCAQQEQQLRQALRRRLASYQRRLQRRDRARTFLALGQTRRLADAPLQWLEDADYANVYERIARATIGVLADACRVDLWEADGRHADLFWSASSERIPELESLLKERRAVDRLPELRQVLITQRSRVIEPSTYAALSRNAAEVNTSRRTAYLLVPIIIAGRARATLTLCRYLSRTRYSADDIARAEDFARRSAIAIVQLLRLEHMIAARHRAEQAEEAKADTLAGFSHDMRTPLMAVNSYTQLLLDQMAGPLTAKQREYLQRIHQAQSCMTGFVDRVLTLHRLDRDHEGPGPFAVDLCAVARDVAALFAVECQLKNLRIELPDASERTLVRADPEKVWRVLQNLISNAVKYTPASGRISLTWQRVHDRIEVRVSDNGRGVPNQELEAIFRPFYQVDPNTDGSGLGLSISRSLAHEMGGDLQVASEPGRGSTFTLRLPRADESGTKVEPLLVANAG
jgi:signal transduction histidine kinase